ncbi:hypothetical protein [Aestuariicoccus sp. MJ-SS9]|uniref:hypothetical protein n=1 Tax=Aestuariicoccus sp. MJ-SS9 TaxID=3079855 RepID=UPI0039776C53
MYYEVTLSVALTHEENSLHHLPLAPFGDGFDVDAKLPAQFRVRSLRSLYCCSDGVRSRGVSVP